MKELRMGTRGSKLALVQSRDVQRVLLKAHAGIRVGISVIQTVGDRESSVPFSEIGAKGIFTKEIDEALLSGRIDAATHSLKDVASGLPKGIKLAAITACLDPRDALVSRDGVPFSALPEGSRVGTSSLRRAAIARRLRPDLKILDLRGNVDTRLRKLDEGEYDAILLASAGLKRLGLESRITENLDPEQFVPAVGQGFLGIACRRKDQETQRIVSAVDDPAGHRLAGAQRVFLARMEGGCRVPLGCHGRETGDRLELIGYLATADGGEEIRERVIGPVAEAKQLGEKLALEILRKGGESILQRLRREIPG
jgi:hydroxymethylbilane synthase